MKINKNSVTKVIWQKEALEWDENPKADMPRWLDWTYTSLTPSAFGASTLEEMLAAAHRLKFSTLPCESLIPCEDGSFMMSYRYGTLRVIFQQEAPKPRTYTEDEVEGWLADYQHDFPVDI